MIGDHISSWMRRRRTIRQRFNPYIVGTPVFDQNLFFGRETLAQHALHLLGSRSIQLTGERRIGKTSFLHHIRHALAAENGEGRAYPIFVDLEAVVARDLFRALAEEAVEAFAVPLRTLVDLRVSRRESEYLAADLHHDLRRMVQELTSLTRRPMRLVFLIDEVDAVRGGPAPGTDSWLGPLLRALPELRAVLAGASPHGNLDALEIEPFTQHDAEALVRGPVAGVYGYERRAVERILQASRLRPFAIQRLCLHAVNRMLDEGRTSVRAADVEAVSDAVRGASGVEPVQCE